MSLFPFFLCVRLLEGGVKNGEGFVDSQTAKNNLNSAKWNSV